MSKKIVGLNGSENDVGDLSPQKTTWGTSHHGFPLSRVPSSCEDDDTILHNPSPKIKFSDHNFGEMLHHDDILLSIFEKPIMVMLSVTLTCSMVDMGTCLDYTRVDWSNAVQLLYATWAGTRKGD